MKIYKNGKENYTTLILAVLFSIDQPPLSFNLRKFPSYPYHRTNLSILSNVECLSRANFDNYLTKQLLASCACQTLD